MPTSTSGSAIANSNGKRPIETVNLDDMEEHAMANGKVRQEAAIKTHQPSGYQFAQIEDEPGYTWLNKKAIDEYTRAWDNLQHKDALIKNRYGDPLEVAEKEQALMASLKQR